jgi:hypothetical protein
MWRVVAVAAQRVSTTRHVDVLVMWV